MSTCYCESYSFPHRRGGGDCQDGVDQMNQCSECGGQDFRFVKGSKSPIPSGERFALDPDEQDSLLCLNCGCEKIIKEG